MTEQPRHQWRFALAIVVLAVIWLGMLLALARIFTALGEPTGLVTAGFLVAGWIWWKRHPHLAFAILLIVLVGRGLAEAQKYWIARVRPDLEPHLVVVKTSSFPSGHATSSMIFYLTVAL